MWYKYWSLLSAADREQFSRVINILLAKTFILRERFDTREKTVTVDRDFRFIERHQVLLEEYLSLAGWDLSLDSYYGVAAVTNRFGYNRRQLDRATTYLLYVIRLIYEEEKENLSLRREVVTSVFEIVNKLDHLGLNDKKITDSLLNESFGILKDFNIVERLDGSWTEPQARVIIYPTVLFVVSNERVNYIFNNLCSGAKQGDV